MTEAATVPTESFETSEPGKRPPELRLPRYLQAAAFIGFRRKTMRKARQRLGPVFSIDVPFFGRTVIISDPALVRTVFTASTEDLINVQPNLIPALFNVRGFGPPFSVT